MVSGWVGGAGGWVKFILVLRCAAHGRPACVRLSPREPWTGQATGQNVTGPCWWRIRPGLEHCLCSLLSVLFSRDYEDVYCWENLMAMPTSVRKPYVDADSYSSDVQVLTPTFKLQRGKAKEKYQASLVTRISV